MGNIEAASKGPGAYGRRYVRRRTYAKTNGLLRRLFKGTGLSR
jgi:hypothetical protein